VPKCLVAEVSGFNLAASTQWMSSTRSPSGGFVLYKQFLNDFFVCFDGNIRPQYQPADCFDRQGLPLVFAGTFSVN